MGRKQKQDNPLGKAMARSRFGPKAPDGRAMTMHTTDIDEKAERRKALTSVTQMNDFASFMEYADIAEKDFAAEKQNTVVITADQIKNQQVLLTRDEPPEEQLRNWNDITIPRRPAWDEDTTTEQLDQNEKQSFLDWRRKLAELEEEKQLILTPFEKNLQVWRQLWRVIERSDLVVQIVDCRNPLLFRCPDLEKYVKEIDPEKKNFLLVNKADLLSIAQRKVWAKYFQDANVDFVFFSANYEKMKLEQKTLEKQKLMERMDTTDLESAQIGISDIEIDSKKTKKTKNDQNEEEEEENDDDFIDEDDIAQEIVLNDDEQVEQESDEEEDEEDGEDGGEEEENKEEGEKGEDVDVPKKKLTPVHIYNREELIDVLLSYRTGTQLDIEGNPKKLSIGMVGYPNVGKSSTINVLCGEKKVSVSATPGKTKHFQTINFEDLPVTLFDCPGLVFPTFMSTKSEMICNGLLSIDHMRDFVGPISLVCHRIPRKVLEVVYGIVFPKPKPDEDPTRDPTCEELLHSYCIVRGMMVDHGTPYRAKAARLILKDYVTGALCFCHPPPGSESKEFNSTTKYLNKKLSEKKQEFETSYQPPSDDTNFGTTKKYQRAHKKHLTPTMKPDNSDNYRVFMGDKNAVTVHTKGKANGTDDFSRRKTKYSPVSVAVLKQMKQQARAQAQAQEKK